MIILSLTEYSIIKESYKNDDKVQNNKQTYQFFVGTVQYLQDSSYW